MSHLSYAVIACAGLLASPASSAPEPNRKAVVQMRPILEAAPGEYLDLIVGSESRAILRRFAAGPPPRRFAMNLLSKSGESWSEQALAVSGAPRWPGDTVGAELWPRHLSSDGRHLLLQSNRFPETAGPRRLAEAVLDLDTMEETLLSAEDPQERYWELVERSAWFQATYPEKKARELFRQGYSHCQENPLRIFVQGDFLLVVRGPDMEGSLKLPSTTRAGLPIMWWGAQRLFGKSVLSADCRSGLFLATAHLDGDDGRKGSYVETVFEFGSAASR